MPDFNTAAYANHPINIPPEFPKILKQYTKAAIRTQPKDLLLWSVAYFRSVKFDTNHFSLLTVQLFRSLANGEIPPVKERLEYPVPPTDSGLTPGQTYVMIISGKLCENVTLNSNFRIAPGFAQAAGTKRTRAKIATSGKMARGLSGFASPRGNSPSRQANEFLCSLRRQTRVNLK